MKQFIIASILLIIPVIVISTFVFSGGSSNNGKVVNPENRTAVLDPNMVIGNTINIDAESPNTDGSFLNEDLVVPWPEDQDMVLNSRILRYAGGGFKEGEWHGGVDYGWRDGSHPTNVEALTPMEGTVVFNSTRTGGGNTVEILHPNGYMSIFMHLRESKVSVGQYVPAGTPIGIIGNTGGNYPIHMHWEIFVPGADYSHKTVIATNALIGLTKRSDTLFSQPYYTMEELSWVNRESKTVTKVGKDYNLYIKEWVDKGFLKVANNRATQNQIKQLDMPVFED